MSRPVCIVTGASRGIGSAVARRFAQQGYDLLLTARSADDLESTAGQIEANGASCMSVVADLERSETPTAIVTAAHERYGRIDVVVNNAGVAPRSPIIDLTTDAFDQALRINVAAVFHMTRAVWPFMRSRGQGTIVNISSLAAFDPFPGFAAYGACKAWVNLFTKAAAEEGRSDGIRVFAVAPGAVETSMLRGHFPDFPATQTLTPDDVAQLVAHVCQDAIRHATGETITLRR